MQSRESIQIQNEAGVQTIQKTGILRISFNDEEERRKQEELRKQEEIRKEEARRIEEEIKKREEQEKEKSRTNPDEKSETPLSRSGVLWRSAVLPGWGLTAQGRERTGYAVMGLTLLNLSAALQFRKEALQLKSSYHEAAQFNTALTTALPIGALLGLSYNTEMPARLTLGVLLNSGIQSDYKRQIGYYNASVYTFALLYLSQLALTWFGFQEIPQPVTGFSQPALTLFALPDSSGRGVEAGGAVRAFF